MKSFKRFVSSLLIFSMLMVGMPMSAQAGIVSTEEAMTAQATSTHRDVVQRFLAREDVRLALQEQGIPAQAALDRVHAMSDAEVAELAGQVEQAPAGGFLGTIVFVFLVLLLTDILGLTKVFPFTRSVR